MVAWIAYFCKPFSVCLRKKGGAAMDTITAIRERILHLCAERDISINKLATICALPPSSVKNILYGRSRDPKILTIKKICDGLEITLGEFFDTPDFDSLDQEIK
jgi:DNA-binding Xre family transcriptional regulator